MDIQKAWGHFWCQFCFTATKLNRWTNSAFVVRGSPSSNLSINLCFCSLSQLPFSFLSFAQKSCLHHFHVYDGICHAVETKGLYFASLKGQTWQGPACSTCYPQSVALLHMASYSDFVIDTHLSLGKKRCSGILLRTAVEAERIRCHCNSTLLSLSPGGKL